MAANAALITAIAALAAAVAWPAVFMIAVLTYRKEIRQTVAKIPSVIDRMKALKLGAIETELDKAADRFAIEPATNGRVSVVEVEAAAKIAADAAAVGIPALATELDKLCIEYDTIRRVMPPSHRRTSAMVRILVKMRSLGPSVSGQIETYKSSGSPGSRLAAVAMMQMDPQKADLEWLVSRFKHDHPFIFYHAALALQNAANDREVEQLEAVKSRASEALSILKSFGANADRNSIDVLEALVADQFSGHYS